MSKREDIHKILVIGSGPIIIGQACEFDYSGCQAIKALKEDGYYVILVNPNPATMMSTPSLSDKVYMEPLTVNYLEEIIKTERPDAILSTVGGQSGLNLTLDLDAAGILTKYNVEVLGASIDSINKAEDRGLFKDLVSSLNLESPKSVVAHSEEEALSATSSIPFPIIIRPSFTLGGRGGAIAYDLESFKLLTRRALKESPVSEVLIEESLIGWKEFEMEVMRDKNDNAIIVCSIENIDPMGVHTGDSITIAPIQTLNNEEYQDMRDASINILRAVGVDCGGSNVQFAVNPKTKKMIVIEMNPRVSRSSALASKATGFPIAFCSTKLAVGYTLDEVINQITGKSVSCFEPALDYCAVKVPRFELEKFPLKPSALGSQMRSVGESLAIGRTSIEALNKAIRSVERKMEGLVPLEECDVEKYLTNAHPLRIFAIYTVLFNEGEDSMKRLNEITGFDPFFIYQLYLQSLLDHEIIDAKELTPQLIERAKENGMSDKRIAQLAKVDVSEIEKIRENNGIEMSSHFVDTCAGEFKALTPYCYNTYGESDEGEPFGEDAVVILASGPNRIGQGLEFDTCCSLSSMAYRELGRKTIIINSNPETVSTDYNVSDRLYIEPLDGESVKAILKKEHAKKLVIQLGGQTPLNIAQALKDEEDVEIIGTQLSGIDEAEDRGDFAAILKELGLNQAANRMGTTMDEIHSKAREIGYPILLRPSFVLGGRSMFIAYSEEDVDTYFKTNEVSFDEEHPILIDQFIEDAFEYDLDAISDGEDIYIGGILQHIEAAGIHSGDSAAVFPPYKSSPEILEQMRCATLKIARRMNLVGFINIQFAVKDEILYIIEVNPRASRTVPFISKYSKVNLIETAVKVWEGISLKEQKLVPSYSHIGEGKCHAGWAIKEAVFSFDRFIDIDPLLGPEMRSTGETTGSGESFGEAYAKSQISSGNKLPTSGKVLISVNKKDRKTIVPVAKQLIELGFEIAATQGTARDLFEEGILCEVMLKTKDGHPNIVDHLNNRRIDLVINTPMGFHSISSNDDIRSVALLQKIPYTTTTSAAVAAVEGIKYLLKDEAKVSPIPQFIN
ncbi:MAG: carbamoyl-phosphate synthase large subunit [Sphaerochaetaceae bacterium]|nr:carbamoyl-phosphate synthase large subunit [Sphaerochaetaceae bacterium]